MDSLVPVCGDTTPGCPLRSTWGTSLGEGKLGATARILTTKVACGANIPPGTHANRKSCVRTGWTRYLTPPCDLPLPLRPPPPPGMTSWQYILRLIYPPAIRCIRHITWWQHVPPLFGVCRDAAYEPIQYEIRGSAITFVSSSCPQCSSGRAGLCHFMLHNPALGMQQVIQLNDTAT
jgi:ribosomal protein S27AE